MGPFLHVKKLGDGVLVSVSQDSVSPSPLGTNWAFELGLTGLWLGLGGLGTKGFGTGLDNFGQNKLGK